MKEITLEAKIQNIPEATMFVDTELEALECGIRQQTQIDVAVDEIFTNIASYAYGSGTGEATIRFEFDEATRTVRISFIDTGMEFNPLEKDDPDVSLSAEERQIGGLGIFLVKKTMDKMTYLRTEGQNILTIYKKI